MSTETLLCIEMDLFCAMYISIMVANIWRSKASSREDKSFFCGSIAIGVILFTDIVSMVLNGRPGQLVRATLYVDDVVYFIFTGLAAYACLLYVDYILCENSFQVDERRIMYFVPIAGLIVLTLASCRFGYIFYLDENNVYHRGNLHVAQQIITTLYFIMAECYSLVYLIKSKNDLRRSLCLRVVAFTTVPLLGLILQIMFPSIAIIWPLSSVGLFIMFSYVQNSQISMDALTGLNNRSRLFKYLLEKCEKHDNRQVLTCIVYDIDNFKSINDRYGHYVGDIAIQQMANAIKKSVAGVAGSHFIARYTGNSFVVVSISENGNEETLISNFNSQLEDLNNSKANQFQISVSIGAAIYDKDIMNSDDFLKAADNDMYKNKATTKALKHKVSVEDVVK